MDSHFKAIIAASLIAVTVTGFAQSGDQSAQPATNPQTNHKDPTDTSKGQDLVSPATPTDTNPASAGQDKSAGNNLVQPEANGQMAMGVRPDFKMIDSKNHGYVLASEVNTPWLKQNFTKCDADSDGKVTKAEYEMCAKQ